MRNACLVDTNILVYAYDNSVPEKQSVAENLLDNLVLDDRGLLTVQVLAEFYVVVTRRMRQPLTPEEAEVALLELAESFQVCDLTTAIVLEAARGVRQYSLSYWDAQIWASAKLNQVPVILTEDQPSASVIEGVRFVDPFGTDAATRATLTTLGLIQ